ncbi:MAG: DUF2059 domain-containing protein [Bradyrhizobiaceae bacterium]|nr:DUF2059 domain-containing protein [Bradyrhizobiaceae bacterium]
MIANKPTLAIGHLALVVALSLFVTTGATQAQQPSAAAVDLARQVILIKGGSNMFDPIVPGVIETAKNNFLPTNPGLSKDLNEVALQLRKEFEPKRAELLTEVARAYAERFSEQELKELLAFYKSPLGQKVVTEEPRALDAGMTKAQDWANNFSEAVMSRMRAEMKKRGHDL